MSEGTSKGRPVGQVNKIYLIAIVVVFVVIHILSVIAITIAITIFIVFVMDNNLLIQVAPAQRSTDAPGGVGKQGAEGDKGGARGDSGQPGGEGRGRGSPRGGMTRSPGLPDYLCN